MYEVTIDNFNGPLDLLLHLIKKSNISITEISIDKITKQYLDYIREMEELNLDVASEYLVMAAELIEMKSKTLLPSSDIDEDEYEEDPKQRLIERLIEYEQYKNMTDNFKTLEEVRSEVYTKEPDSLLQYKDDESFSDYGVDINDLLNAFSKFLEEKELEKPLNTKISSKEYSLSRRNKEIRNILKKKKKVKFTELFETFNKEYVVITFLSILSLARNEEIELEQENNFKDIILKEKGVL